MNQARIVSDFLSDFLSAVQRQCRNDGLRSLAALLLFVGLVGCHASPQCDKLTSNLKEDSGPYRACVAKNALADFLDTQVKPGDELIDLMPQGTVAIELVNPGFDFTYDDGEKVPAGTWITPIQEGEPGSMRRFNQSLGLSDPIKGWSSIGCSGVEATRRFNTMPDVPTAYMVAHGKDYTLYQTLENQLKPNTRYTLMVEVYARSDYRAPKANEMLLYLTDEENNPVQASKIEKVLTTTDSVTGFAMALISVTTHADQPEDHLRIHLGFNAEGNVRVNYDNVKLWAQPVE